jgi:hypothetical protein
MASNAPVTGTASDTDLQVCVVCGMGSHRKDWRNKAAVGGKVFVACDNHSAAEVNAAAAKAAQASPAAPNGGTKVN